MNERKLEFIARTITDIGKAIVIGSIIGNFFHELPFMVAILIIGLGILLMFIGIILYPDGEKQ